LEYLAKTNEKNIADMIAEKKGGGSDNPKKVFTATAVISVIPVILGLVGLFYLQGMKKVIAYILAIEEFRSSSTNHLCHGWPYN
jgi:hypothetical protein